MIAKLSVIDAVERERAPDIDPIPKQVNIPDPFTNIIPSGDTPLLQVQIAREAIVPAENAPPPSANNEGKLGAQVEAPEPSQAQRDVATSPTEIVAPAATPPAEVVAPAAAPPTEVAAPKVEPGPGPANDGNAQARAVQRDQAEGQATNNPIAEQEVGGTVNVAV